MAKVDDKLELNYFLVTAKGYKKQFSSGLQARRVFSRMEKEANENNDPVSVQLFGKKKLTDKWILLDEVEIKASYYDA